MSKKKSKKKVFHELRKKRARKVSRKREKKKSSSAAGKRVYIKPLGRPGYPAVANSYADIVRLLDAGALGLDHLPLELENISLTIWVPVTGDISESNLNFVTRTHTYSSYFGMESFGFPIYGDAVIQKTNPKTGLTESMTDSDIAFVRSMIGETDTNPIIPVYLTAFGSGEIRLVNVPDDTADDDLLDQTFYYGQNDFQPQTAVSVSVGDVIKLPDGSLYRVMASGFKRLPEDYNPLTHLGMDAVREGYSLKRNRGRLRRRW